MKSKENIPAEIASIDVLTVGGVPASIPLKLRLLTNLYFNRRHEQGDMLKIMLAIERQVKTLDDRANDAEGGFEDLWSSFDSRFSSVRSVAKTAMKIGFMAGKLKVTE